MTRSLSPISRGTQYGKEGVAKKRASDAAQKRANEDILIALGGSAEREKGRSGRTKENWLEVQKSPAS